MDEYTAAQVLRLPSGSSRLELPRLWFSHTHREVMDDSQRTTEDNLGSVGGTLVTTKGGPGNMEEVLETMEEGQVVTDTPTRTPSPTCC